MKLSIPTSGLKEYVHQLASVYGITYKKTESDEFAETATRLAGDNVVTDDVENIIVELKRAHVIDSKTMVELLGNYLDELHYVSGPNENSFTQNLVHPRCRVYPLVAG